MDKVADVVHHHDESSSLSEDKSPSPSSMRAKIRRFFGREKHVHSVFGADGKPADVFLWRNKKISAGVLGGATGIWVLVELMQYHLLTLVCHFLILALTVLFIWSAAAKAINMSAPHIPDVELDEKLVLQFASALRYELNRAFDVLREVALGRELKKCLAIISWLWILSVLGGWCSFLTLLYIAFVLLHTLPVIYEKYGHMIDAYAEKAMIEIRKLSAIFDAKILSKIPRGHLKGKKRE